MIRRFRRPGPAAILAASLLALAGLACQAQAQSPAPSRAEQLIKYRQAIYTLIGGNFGPLAAMVQGKAPYAPREFTVRAERVAYLAQMLGEAFPRDSQTGAPTRAKAQIWSERKEFDRLLEEMQAATAKLAQVARSEDMEQIRPALADAGNACKACHDEFREKKD